MKNRLEIVKFWADRADHFCMHRTRTAMIASICSTISFGFLTLPAHAAASATAPAVGVAPSAANPSALRYVVASGDYLAGIARKLGVPLPDLLSVNQFTTTSLIHPGQALIVPEGGALPAPAAPPAPATPAVVGPYVVVDNDYLAGIAKQLGVSMTSLLTTNKLTITSVIVPGMKLTVPAGGTLPTIAISATPAAPTVQTTGAGATTSTPVVNGASTYTVAAGDYLVGIAAKNGVTLKALLAANNLIVTSAIFPGRQLSVPPATLPIPVAATATPATTDPVAGASQTITASEAPTAAPADAAPSAYQQSINTLVAFLQAQVGKPYVFNTEGPDTYDCSGLVTAAYRQVGIELPHQSALQSTKGTAVDRQTQPLLPGDLIFQYNSANPTVISHVGIVIDSTRWIQAVGSSTPVKISPLPRSEKIVAVRRIVQP